MFIHIKSPLNPSHDFFRGVTHRPRINYNLSVCYSNLLEWQPVHTSNRHSFFQTNILQMSKNVLDFCSKLI
jgi:hypothetical protein